MVLESQLRQIFASVVWTHKIQEKQADIYRNRYNCLETLKIVAAAVTSAGVMSIIFTDGFILKLITAIISMVSVGITTYFKTFDLPGLASEHKASALQLIKIREQIISLLCDIKMNSIDEGKVCQVRDTLMEKMNSIYEGCLDASKKAVNKAESDLKKEGAFTYSDEEIDSYLPIYLRKGRD